MNNENEQIAPWTCFFGGKKNEIITFVMTERVQVEINMGTGRVFILKDGTRIYDDKFYLSEECSFDEFMNYLQKQYRDAIILQNL